MKKAKRNIVIAAVLVFVCAAVYLNWSYNRSEDVSPVSEDAAGDEAETSAGTEDDYFARARLTRQSSRDEALGLLETAAAGEGASQETIDGAMDAIAAMAAWSMQEAQIENLLLAKNFSDCVAYISSDGVTVAVPAPVEGLSAAAVAQVTETVNIKAPSPAAAGEGASRPARFPEKRALFSRGYVVQYHIAIPIRRFLLWARTTSPARAKRAA